MGSNLYPWIRLLVNYDLREHITHIPVSIFNPVPVNVGVGLEGLDGHTFDQAYTPPEDL